jgi:2-polyprenyl-3-methyl-5-hydroxy-6-metoxy-1,4-benzoquinol methylase
MALREDGGYVFDASTYASWVKSYQENDKPLEWFDAIYRGADGDVTKVFWADLEPSPYLVEWIHQCEASPQGKKAIVIGCGVGDDAEALSAYGYEVTAFDISPTAIELCQKRYPDSTVSYVVANLFEAPDAWHEAFDLVYECNTIQVLPGRYRTQARDAMISLMNKGGHILVSCRSRNAGEMEDVVPLPLDKEEIDDFQTAGGLKEVSFLAYDDTQDPPVPHFFACYQK